MRRLPLVAATLAFAIAVLVAAAPAVIAEPAPVMAPHQAGDTDDETERPANVAGLVIGIGLVVVWGLLLAEVLRRAAARRGDARSAPPPP